MPSNRKFMSYRPDDTEAVLLEKLSAKRGLSKSRLIGTSIREMSERENVIATPEEIAEMRDRNNSAKE